MRTRTFATVAILALAGCSSDAEPDVASVSAVEQMEVAFDGNPMQRDIQAALDAAFDATATEPTEENYSRAGSALVAASEEHDVAEMDVLRCIPDQVGDPRIPDDTFPSVTALCSLIVAGEYPATP